MKIFKVGIQKNSHIFNINDRDLYTELWLRKQIWFWLEADAEPMDKVKFYVDVENGPDQEIMDFMHFGLQIVIKLNNKTEKLLLYFQKSWQVIPLNMLKWQPFDDLECNIFNITHVVDCFNEEKSECKYFRDGVRIMDIISYDFIESKIPAWTWFFSIPNKRGKGVFLVTWINKPEEDFYFLYHKLWMTGLKFKEIYRTPWEKDYDIEWTVDAMNNGEKLKKPVFQKGILWSIFT